MKTQVSRSFEDFFSYGEKKNDTPELIKRGNGKKESTGILLILIRYQNQPRQ